MDVMLGTKVWGERYISNPFPYLEQDVTNISEKDFKVMKKIFLDNYKK